jgi:FAD/FMN-containing dehydrogenase
MTLPIPVSTSTLKTTEFTQQSPGAGHSEKSQTKRKITLQGSTDIEAMERYVISRWIKFRYLLEIQITARMNPLATRKRRRKNRETSGGRREEIYEAPKGSVSFWCQTVGRILRALQRHGGQIGTWLDEMAIFWEKRAKIWTSAKRWYATYQPMNEIVPIADRICQMVRH